MGVVRKTGKSEKGEAGNPGGVEGGKRALRRGERNEK